MKDRNMPLIGFLGLIGVIALADAAGAAEQSFQTGRLGDMAVAAGLADKAPLYSPSGVRIRLKPGTDAGPLVRALDSHFACLEIIPDGVTGQGDILQDCDSAEPTNGWRVHAH